MADASRRVALLARPGAARDSVRGALLEIGAEIVCEDDPTSAQPADVRGAAPDVLMIVLDTVSEGALDRFDALLGDPSIEVMFEEADVAAARDGWEAARWRRHLAAKLGHREDVLPPVAGADLVPAVDPLSMSIEALISTDDAGFPPAAQQDVPADATGGQDFTVFDPAAAGSSAAGVEDYVLSVHGLELEPSALDAPLPAVPGLGLDSDFGAPPAVPGADFTASDFSPLLAELDAEIPDLPLPESMPALPEADWQGGLVDDFVAADTVSLEDVAPAPSGAPHPATHFGELGLAGDVAPSTATSPALPSMGFGELSLVDDATPVAAGASGAVRHRDLGEIERRIASLELVDDAGPAAATPPPIQALGSVDGAVLVLAGIGGPDAVRQLLGALPAQFPRAVLVRQRLDGARYDKLVAQLQRASSMPVALAQPGEAVHPGLVYVLGDDVGLTDGATAFVDGGGPLVGKLPPSESAVIVLSGADAADVDPIAGLIPEGAFVGAQAPDNCYDAAAASALTARGATTASPSELAASLVGRWAR